MDMTDPTPLILASSVTLAIAALSAALLRAFRLWLAMRRESVGQGAPASTRSRTEIAELRSRIRRLEAIADGA